ncbi:MAG: hypothetical protein KJO98_09650 [Rhodothermia bacterium]|nr:hypothetical protein [Rhodothermia bacterium]NNE45615.1 hypothetical protein [Rhodothermales bacterium]
MKEILNSLEVADYDFVAALMKNWVNFTDDAEVDRRIRAFEASGSEEDRARVVEKLEREIRYLGSSDIAYVMRYVTGREPGVSFREILRDVAHTLKVRPDRLGTDREVTIDLVHQYATSQFADLSADEQQRMLEDLGVEKEKATAFLMRSAGVFALPVMIEAFSAVIVEGLIKRVVLATIAKFLGEQAAQKIFLWVAGRFPWWLKWVGPAAWTASVSWTALDLQGPAMRKTVPVVLYLGLCCVRQSVPAAE